MTLKNDQMGKMSGIPNFMDVPDVFEYEERTETMTKTRWWCNHGSNEAITYTMKHSETWTTFQYKDCLSR